MSSKLKIFQDHKHQGYILCNCRFMRFRMRHLVNNP